MTSETLHGEDQTGNSEDADDPGEKSVIQDDAVRKKYHEPSMASFQAKKDAAARDEESPAEVARRFAMGCECQEDDCCFAGLSPEAVYRHRLNIAELTKAEHDMYLMGVTMACLADPLQTARNKERRRSRARYVYQGRRVCLDAFLYLENCTRYQVKRIRKHLRVHGVAPRVHGNHGKIPHNTFSLEIYRNATRFLEDFVEERRRVAKTKTTKMPIQLPPEITRKTVHELYTRYSKDIGSKVMGYSTFRRFMKVQFPQVKFPKIELVVRNSIGNNAAIVKTDNDEERVETRDLYPEETTRNDYVIIDEDRAGYRLAENGMLVDRDGVPLTLRNIEPILTIESALLR